MAIKPQQALELTKRELKEVAKLETKVDAEVADLFRGGSIIVPLSCYSVQPRVIEELARRYKEAGWSSVAYSFEQHDGSRIELGR
jgi:hypothetical protein